MSYDRLPCIFHSQGDLAKERGVSSRTFFAVSRAMSFGFGTTPQNSVFGVNRPPATSPIPFGATAGPAGSPFGGGIASSPTQGGASPFGAPTPGAFGAAPSTFGGGAPNPAPTMGGFGGGAPAPSPFGGGAAAPGASPWGAPNAPAQSSFQTSTPWGASSSTPSPGISGSVQNACAHWNRSNCRYSGRCRSRHVCSTCGDSSHKAPQCPRGPGSLVGGGGGFSPTRVTDPSLVPANSRHAIMQHICAMSSNVGISVEELRLQSRENPPGAVAGTGVFGLSPNTSGSGTGTAVGVFGNIGGAFGGGSTIPSTFGSGPGADVPPAGSMFPGGGAGGFGGGSGGFNAGAGFGGATGGFGASSAVPNAFGTMSSPHTGTSFAMTLPPANASGTVPTPAVAFGGAVGFSTGTGGFGGASFGGTSSGFGGATPSIGGSFGAGVGRGSASTFPASSPSPAAFPAATASTPSLVGSACPTPTAVGGFQSGTIVGSSPGLTFGGGQGSFGGASITPASGALPVLASVCGAATDAAPTVRALGGTFGPQSSAGHVTLPYTAQALPFFGGSSYSAPTMKMGGTLSPSMTAPTSLGMFPLNPVSSASTLGRAHTPVPISPTPSTAPTFSFSNTALTASAMSNTLTTAHSLKGVQDLAQPAENVSPYGAALELPPKIHDETTHSTLRTHGSAAAVFLAAAWTPRLKPHLWMTGRGSLALKPRGSVLASQPSRGATVKSAASEWLLTPRSNPRDLFIKPTDTSNESIREVEPPLSLATLTGGGAVIYDESAIILSENAKKAGYSFDWAVVESPSTIGSVSGTLTRMLRGFRVTRKDFGSVRWIDPVDISHLTRCSLDRLVRIERGAVYVYGDSDTKDNRSPIPVPPPGEGLKKRAAVVLLGVKPTKSSQTGGTFAKRVVKRTRAMGAELVEYDEGNGVWRFELEL